VRTPKQRKGAWTASNTQQRKDKLNALDGKTWTRYSVSIWDTGKSVEEARLGHPAVFPVALVERLLEIYTHAGDLVLDPFMGAGSTLVAARRMGRRAIGFEIAPQFVALAKKRLGSMEAGLQKGTEETIYAEDARNLTSFVKADTIDLVVTSPPYWNIHQQRRTADGKTPRPYTSSSEDLGNIDSYSDFLAAVRTVFQHLFTVVKPGRWCVLIVMDLRKADHFYALHIDCINQMTASGFRLEDIIIWDRRSEYHNLRPLGFPTTFRVNKAHEYILIFQKPSPSAPKP
jgi:DNA modification methylase